MNKTILYHDDARKALEKGMDTLSEAVAITLGPKGRNVVLEKKYASPQIINDGVTIAKEIELKDSIQNTGVALIRQAASKTNDVAGDGTTTATVLAYAIVKEGLKNVAAGSNPIVLKKGINKAVKFVTQKISQYARPIDSSSDISQVASISAGNDIYTGKMIADAIQQVGREGIISLEEGQSTETYLEIKEGMKFDKGFISPYFVTDTSRMEVEQENVYLLLTDKKITLIQEELLPVLEQVSKTGMSLLIIAEDIEKEALATIVVNKLRGIINVAAVRAPGFGDRRKSLLEDIAILTSGDVISDDTGLVLNKISLSNLGVAKKVKISKDSTTIIADSNQSLVNQRCDQIRKQMNISDNSYEKEKLQERLAKLSSGVAIIKVGAATETEMKDKKLRLEDAINATKAAIEEGIVPGGGATYVHLSKDLLSWAENNLSDEELVGALIVQRSLSVPLARISMNAGLNGAVIVEKVKQSSFPNGYNINSNSLLDMYNAGVIDPAKVTRSALQNAASIASMILTTECIIVDSI
uniref:Chaperonin GroEL, chloroplastic n=1 Tax=Polysiphonia sertularioides TaxID=945028 RepID=A0A1Z1M9L4_9FLOR|nr:60-kDa chaperonin [Polysiphonia sertularioides]ARW62582.1 60-kDa chaperonin [Polysiphonia sertularioides]